MEKKSFMQAPPTLKDELIKLQNKVKSLEERIVNLENKSESNNMPIHSSPYKLNNMPTPTIFSGQQVDVTSILNQNRRK